MHELLPEGIDHVWDAPWPLFDALHRALAILNWEQLPEEDQPPENIWNDNRALRAHFDAVKRKHKAGADPGKQIEDPVENEAARALIVE